MRSILWFLYPILFLALPSSLPGQVGNGIPFNPAVPEVHNSVSYTLDMRDATIYDRTYDRFMPGINWGKHPTRRQNDAMGFSVYDGFVIPNWANDPLVAHLPNDARLIAVNDADNMNLFQRLSWGYGTRTDPELAIDTETGFGVLRAGDQSGAIRTCKRHPDVVVQDSIISLAPTLTTAGIPTTVLWENQNADVLHYQQLQPPTDPNTPDAYADYNGNNILVTILLRVPAAPTGLTEAQKRQPVLTLRLKGGLIWSQGKAAVLNGSQGSEVDALSANNRVVFTKPGKDRHRAIVELGLPDPDSRPFTVGVDGSITRVTSDGPFVMPYNEVIDLWFSSVPRNATAADPTPVATFPTNPPAGWPAGTIKGREWVPVHGRTAADESQGRAEEDVVIAGVDDPVNPEVRTLKQMTITRGMLSHLPAGEWVAFTAAVRFQSRTLKKSWETERLANLASRRHGSNFHPMPSFSNPQLQTRKGDAAETQVRGLLFELDYHGHHAVDIAGSVSRRRICGA